MPIYDVRQSSQAHIHPSLRSALELAKSLRLRDESQLLCFLSIEPDGPILTAPSPTRSDGGSLSLIVDCRQAKRAKKRAELKGAITKTARFDAAKEAELTSLKHYCVHEVVFLDPLFNVYSSRWVLSEKKPLITGDPLRAKARLVVQKFCVQGSPDGATKTDLGCLAPTAGRSSLKLIIHI